MKDETDERKIAELRERMAALDLYSEDSQTRERGIATFPEEDRARLRDFLKRSVDSGRFISIMMTDLGRASSALGENYHDQFLRRASVRVVAATVEGLIYTLKEMTAASAELNRIKLPDDDFRFLLERKALSAGEKPKFLPFKDNVKHTFNLYAKYSGFQNPVSFSDDGFAALNETFALRDRVMHPKDYLSFGVNTQEAKRAGEAISWLQSAMDELVGKHNAKLNANIRAELDGTLGSQ